MRKRDEQRHIVLGFNLPCRDSIELLEFFGRQLGGRACDIGTFRSSQQLSQNLDALDALLREERTRFSRWQASITRARALCHEHEGHAADAERLASCIADAGNPLFVSQIVRAGAMERRALVGRPRPVATQSIDRAARIHVSSELSRRLPSAAARRRGVGQDSLRPCSRASWIARASVVELSQAEAQS